MAELLRQHAEQQFAEELDELAKADTRPRPPSWQLSPWAVATYLLGGTLANGFQVSAQVHRQPAPDRDRHRHAGHRPRRCCCSACPARPRPGCPSTWPRPSPATRPCWCRARPAPSEEAIRYGWNYARLLAEGPTHERAGAQPGDARHAGGPDRARRGADAHPVRRAGHADHDPLRRRRCRSPSWATRCRRSRASTSSPPPTTATAASTSCPAR